ncbi:MAG: OmpH family outer membrane protein [Candidatus Koribacter versatilis]|uniref:OmpH family outer membrane protein n=1 Tax=Candidatus Korobacter versatilis TaxID=658062 RepID=A0A932AA06_9BACT|nr:OmpH family outer membrane protein [Candidatus Koribacter versatilis]
MNRTYARLALSLAIALSVTALAQTSRAAASPASPAAPAPSVSPSKIGIINIKGAIVASNEGQRDFEALQKRFDPKNSELKTRNDEIEGLKKQLQAQGDKMNEDARAGLIRQIESKQTALKRFVEDTQADLNSQQNELAKSIGSKLMKSLDKYARDNGFALIMDYSTDQSGVLWVGQGVDITSEVITAYNTDSGVPAQPKAAAPAAPSASKPAAKPATTTPTPAKPR